MPRVAAVRGVLAEMPTVVPPEDDQGFFPEAGLFEGLDHKPNLSVAIALNYSWLGGYPLFSMKKWLATDCMIEHLHHFIC